MGSQPTISGTLAAGNPAKILVIEDDTLTRRALCQILARAGYAPLEACNGFMGLKIFRQQHPDLVITDLLMPDKEGLETISEIRAMDRLVPIIAMSSGGSSHNMSFLELSAEVGANYTIVKPFRPAEMLQIIREACKAGAEKCPAHA